MLKKAISLIAISASFTSLNADAGKKLPSGYTFSRQLPLGLGFASKFTTNQSVSDFHIALEKDTGWIFDKGHQWLNPQQVWTRVAYKYFLYPLVMSPFYKSLRMTTDAYGKMSRIKSLGIPAVYVGNAFKPCGGDYWSIALQNMYKSYKGLVGSVDKMDVMAAHRENFDITYSSDFATGTNQLCLRTLMKKAESVQENDAVDPNKTYLNGEVAALLEERDGYLTPRGKVWVRAAGYNARMAHTRNIEDTLWYDGGGHLAQLSNHTMNKLAYTIDSIGVLFQRNTTGKVNSELGRIQAAYQSMGIECTWKEMGICGAITFLGSAEFWGRFFEEVDYISSGDAYVRAPEIAGFRLPNLGFYLTSQGPSYQINTGYRWGQDLFFPLAVEFVFKGPNKMVEIISGVRKQFTWMGTYLHGEVVVNPHQSALGGKIAAGLKPTKNTFVDLGVRLDNVNTLDGERNIRSLKNAKWCPSISASVGVSF